MRQILSFIYLLLLIADVLKTTKIYSPFLSYSSQCNWIKQFNILHYLNSMMHRKKKTILTYVKNAFIYYTETVMF